MNRPCLSPPLVRYQQQTLVTSKAKPRCVVFGSRGAPAAVCKHGPCARPVHVRDEMVIAANSLTAVLLPLSLRLSSLPPPPRSFASCARLVATTRFLVCDSACSISVASMLSAVLGTALFAVSAVSAQQQQYLLGLGTGDITGPIVEVR